MGDALAIKFSKDQIAGIATNLSFLLKKYKISESELATSLSLPSMTIRRLASGETIDPHISTLKQIANYFDVSIDSLIDNNHSINAMNYKKNMPVFVPILDWLTTSQLQSFDDLELSSWKAWQPVTFGEHNVLSHHAFALESKPSMAPRFPLGTLFVIDPHAQPMDGDLILIKIKNDRSLSIREISIDAPKWQLRPTVSGSETIFYSSDEHIIVGTIMLTLLYSRRA